MKNLIKSYDSKTLILPLFGIIFLFITLSFVSRSNKENKDVIKQKKEAVIRENSDILTVINVITPKEGQQNEIVELLQKGMTQTMRYQSGFISATIHKSMDSDHIIVYAQWKNEASLQEAVKLIEAGEAPNMLKVFSSATPDYHPYEVISVNLPFKRK